MISKLPPLYIYAYCYSFHFYSFITALIGGCISFFKTISVFFKVLFSTIPSLYISFTKSSYHFLSYSHICLTLSCFVTVCILKGILPTTNNILQENSFERKLNMILSCFQLTTEVMMVLNVSKITFIHLSTSDSVS